MLILKCIFECINSTNVSCWFTVATLCATVKVRPVKSHGLPVSLTDFGNFSSLKAHGRETQCSRILYGCSTNLKDCCPWLYKDKVDSSGYYIDWNVQMKSVAPPPLWLCTDIICVSQIRLCMMLIIIKNPKHETPRPKSANNNRANLPPVQIRRASDFPRINCFESVALTDA